MTRVADWDVRLAAFLRARRAQGFAWGQRDCALFAADWVKEATGEDPAAAYRGKYRTAAGALKALRRQGHGDLAEAVTAALGPPLETTALMGRGDIGQVQSIDSAFEGALGVCAGADIAVLSEDGVVLLPRKAALKAWRV